MKKVLLLCLSFFALVSAFGQASDLFFSEYIEGGSSNKYLEIFNGTGMAVDLSDYKVELYSNSKDRNTASQILNLSGSLSNENVYTIGNSGGTIFTADINHQVTYFNGDDAIALIKISTGQCVDIIGCIGEDPGSAWIDGSHSTVNKTLVRKSTVTGGVVTNPASGFPTLVSEWDVFDIDTKNYLGAHTFTPNAPAAVEIPEFSVGSGIYTTSQSVKITSATADATIYYTTDGTVPTDASTLYENAIAVSTTTTLKAIAYKAGMTESSVASATYSFPVNVATVAELRGGLTDGTVYNLIGEVFLTFQQASRNQKLVQDATGGILIDDTGKKITTVYNLNDGITGLTGVLAVYKGLLQFIPSMDPGAASSNNNAVSATEVTISDLKANWSSYESKLVKLSNVSFGAKAGGKFADAQDYTLADNGANEIVLRTNFRGTDLVDNVIPASAIVVGVAAIYDGTHQIIPRGAADISGVSTAVNDVVKQQTTITPNPFHNTIKVTSESKVISVAFYNSVGQLVKEVYNVDSSIPTADLAKGLHIIQVTFEDGSVSTQKVMKK